MKKPLVLVVMDGWGIAPAGKANAISLARKPNFDAFWKEYPHTALKASGIYVGLPPGFQGNSEVGHLNMGSGRMLLQSLERINRAMKSGDFFRNREFLAAIENCKRKGSALHLMGLVQDQGVHAHQDHLYALLRLCSEKKLDNVWVHFFADGRDTPPKSAKVFLRQLEGKIAKLGIGKIGTVMGRYYPMDRDRRWERTKIAYEGLLGNSEFRAESAGAAIDSAYARGESDEFIRPVIVNGFPGIEEGDSVIFFNYRLDRARQITKAFVERGFREFERERPGLFFVCMTEYYKGVNARVAFRPIKVKNTLGEVLAKKKLKQLRISETEKYAHVTFFFNGEVEAPNRGEDRILIHSPKVATYDLKPEMSAYEVTDRLVQELKGGKYDVVICNIVNADMVGHTGVGDAVLKAVETVDECIGKIADAARLLGGTMIITADHGNAEMIATKEGEPLTAHTANDVPLIIVSGALKGRKLRSGGTLADVAPTLLEILGIKKPKEMTGNSLIMPSG